MFITKNDNENLQTILPTNNKEPKEDGTAGNQPRATNIKIKKIEEPKRPHISEGSMVKS